MTCEQKPYRVHAYLGRGVEGAVYLVDNGAKDRLVVKVFWEHLAPDEALGLERYSTLRFPKHLGLPTVRIVEDNERVMGCWYPYQVLTHVHSRLFWHFDVIAEALFSSFCRMQSNLIASGNLFLKEALISQFMLDRGGRFQFIDFGRHICRMDASSLDCGWPAYSLLLLVTSIYNVPDLYERFPVETAYVQEQPCKYFTRFPYEEELPNRPWLRELFGELRSQPASVMLDPGVYACWGKRYASRVAHASVVITASRFLHLAYTRLARAAYGLPEEKRPASLAQIVRQVNQMRRKELSEGRPSDSCTGNTAHV